MAKEETEFVEMRGGVELHKIKKHGDEGIAAALRKCDVAAGTLRELLVPPGAGIELTYAEKQREALQFFATNPEPEDYGDYPFLAAEAYVDGGTVASAAAAILYRAEVFRTVGPVIEIIRRQARKKILSDNSAGVVRAAVASVSVDTLVAVLKARGMTDKQLLELKSGAR